MIKAVFFVFTSKAKKAFGFNSPNLGYLQQSKKSIWFLNTQKTGYLNITTPGTTRGKIYTF
jgi:hypothetical protein